MRKTPLVPPPASPSPATESLSTREEREKYAARLEYAREASSYIVQNFLEPVKAESSPVHQAEIQTEIEAVKMAANEDMKNYRQALQSLPPDSQPAATAITTAIQRQYNGSALNDEAIRILERAAALLPDQKDVLRQEMRSIPTAIAEISKAAPTPGRTYEQAGQDIAAGISRQLEDLGAMPSESPKRNYSEVLSLVVENRIMDQARAILDAQPVDNGLKSPQGSPARASDPMGKDLPRR